MSSRKIGRRKFIKGASSAFLGLAAAPFLNVNPSFADTEKTVTPDNPNSGKDRIKGDGR